MARFYFHLHNDVDIRDDEGVELADDAAMLRLADTNAREMAAENVREGRLNLSHYIEVTDDAGETVYTVHFGEVVEIVG